MQPKASDALAKDRDSRRTRYDPERLLERRERSEGDQHRGRGGRRVLCLEEVADENRHGDREGRGEDA